MKKYILSLLIIFSCCAFLAAADEDWRISKGTHFIVYYANAPEDFIRQVIDRSEDYYNKIADDLGFRRYNFWLWDNRAKIYVYDNARDYQSASGLPAWSAGAVKARPKIIQTFPGAKGFFETILPHELGHIIFREFVGFDNPAIPLWLDEGVASYQEKSKYALADDWIREAIKKGNFMSLEKLSHFASGPLVNKNTIQLFYFESFSIVDFLIREFGRDNFVFFCQNLRDKKDLNRAIASIFRFSNLQELDSAWQKYLQNG